ncbi:MAG: PVC-type heme-binding CxxCH protein [Sphingobacteriaceae bacterium]
MKIKRILFKNKVILKCAQLSFLIAIFLTTCKEKSKYQDPLSPEASIKTFQFADDFKAEIFATEPLVIDPVSMEFDEQGNAYVVGMLDAYKPDAVKGKGNIVMLKDLNGDGRADTAIVFADSIREATSVLPWNGGLLVAAAPNIMFYKDTNGDGVADVKEILFTGFFDKNEEAQITNLRFGIDNWIYANNTGQVGEITFTRKPEAPKLIMQGADFRFRLDRNLFERSTGPGQFGLAIDDWGHRFFTANSLHIREAVTPLRYLDRNPFLPAAAKNSVQNISDHDPLMYQQSATPLWRQLRTDRRNKEFQENKLDRVEYARDHFTGASGGTYYDGDRLPKEYYGNIFTGDVAGNLVHRDILSADKDEPFMAAKRGEHEKEKEFLATTDSWFRPASLTTGADGYLYLIDMYRQHIETPMSIPEDLQVGMDFDAGNKYGRIYRIVPKHAGPYKKVSHDLKNTSSADLVRFLSDDNRFWRLQAQRLLLERQDKSVIPAVKGLFAGSADARFRLHALYVLEGLEALDANIVKAAMKDPSSGLRENAAILSERFPNCLPQLKELTSDSTIRVAFQATLSLGQFKDKSILPVLSKVVEQKGQSTWFRTAVLSSEAGSGIDMVNMLEKGSFFKEETDWKLIFFEMLANVIGERNQRNQITGLIDFLSKSPKASADTWRLAGVKGLVKGMETAKGTAESLKEKLATIGLGADQNSRKALEDLKKLYLK